MKVAILAGGLGTRLQEETQVKPKPMVEIGGRPIIWHIMKIYAAQGFNEFVVALGYKGGIIKDYFLNYRTRDSNLVVDLESGDVKVWGAGSLENWRIHLIDTGANSMTGGRIKRVAEYLDGEPFMATYGDGVADIDLAKLIERHESSGSLATVTAVRPPARFGQIQLDELTVNSFAEKPQTEGGWINGGFFIFEPQIKDYIADDATILEKEPLERLAREGRLSAYKHEGFWQCMDTLRDVEYLSRRWNEDDAPWKVWS